MKKYILLIISVLCLACNQKQIQLPKVEKAEIYEVFDHSPIYFFFEESTKSVKMNRNGLISTTNWIFNIDARGDFKDISEKIAEMQQKKLNPFNPHSNPDSKNYFSVADMQKKSLGFVDFSSNLFLKKEKLSENNQKNTFLIKNEGVFFNNEPISVENLSNFNKNETYHLLIDENMSFQAFFSTYVKIKEILTIENIYF